MDEELLKTILFRTLYLLSDLNVALNNFPAARNAIHDLEMIERNEADTYILKIRVLLSHCFKEISNAESNFSVEKLS